MAQVLVGTFTVADEGDFELDLGFVPDLEFYFASGKVGLTENTNARMSIGVGSIDFQGAEAALANNTYKNFGREYHGNDIAFSSLSVPGGVITATTKFERLGTTASGVSYHALAGDPNVQILGVFIKLGE